MIRNIYTLLFIFLFGITVHGAAPVEEAPSIRGQVIDAGTGQPLEFATVSVVRADDKSLITGSITDAEGRFSLAVEPGEYVVKIQFVTFETKEISVIVGQGNRNPDLGTISMKPSVSELDEVVVSGERTQMQLSLDKNVEGVHVRP